MADIVMVYIVMADIVIAEPDVYGFRRGICIGGGMSNERVYFVQRLPF